MSISAFDLHPVTLSGDQSDYSMYHDRCFVGTKHETFEFSLVVNPSRANGEVTMSNAMDAYLSLNGYCRKAIVRDGSCIFRAASEKVSLIMSVRFLNV